MLSDFFFTVVCVIKFVKLQLRIILVPSGWHEISFQQPLNIQIIIGIRIFKCPFEEWNDLADIIIIHQTEEIMLQYFTVLHLVDFVDAFDENLKRILSADIFASHHLRFECKVEGYNQVVSDPQMTRLLNILGKWIILGKHVEKWPLQLHNYLLLLIIFLVVIFLFYVLLDLVDDCLRIVEIYVTHGLPSEKLLRLEETFLHLDVDIESLIGVHEEEIKIAKEYWFHLHHHSDRVLVQVENLPVGEDVF